MATYDYQIQAIPWTGGATVSYIGTGNTNTWQYWNTTTTGTAASTIWNTWTSGTGSTIGYQTAWNTWNGTGYQGYGRSPVTAQVPLTPEEVQAAADALRVAMAQAEERAAREREDRVEAEQRAEELLCSQLRPGQLAMLRRQQKFYVRSEHGRRYEIVRGHHQNVYEVDSKGKHLKSFCIYATGGVPDADSMLAQKLHLEMNEDHFLAVAHPLILAA